MCPLLLFLLLHLQLVLSVSFTFFSSGCDLSYRSRTPGESWVLFRSDHSLFRILLSIIYCLSFISVKPDLFYFVSSSRCSSSFRCASSVWLVLDVLCFRFTCLLFKTCLFLTFNLSSCNYFLSFLVTRVYSVPGLLWLLWLSLASAVLSSPEYLCCVLQVGWTIRVFDIHTYFNSFCLPVLIPYLLNVYFSLRLFSGSFIFYCDFITIPSCLRGLLTTGGFHVSVVVYLFIRYCAYCRNWRHVLDAIAPTRSAC
jgi:hypothetical protein